MSLDIGPRCEQHIRATHILCIDNRIQFDVLQYIRDAPILCIDNQGCISCGILVSGIGARGVSPEHMENMEMFSCSPT